MSENLPSNENLSAKSAKSFSIASVLAVVCASATFFVGAGAQFALAIIAIIFGVIGLIFALSPKTRGGFASIIAILIAIVAVGIAITRGILHLF
ncbi:MAG: hypothetical protein ACI9R3_000172 [Verrucomicrobiales bacterium]|jgi:hypothetical protein